MAGKTISQRISLEGAEDIRKALEQLGKSGEAAFKQIQDAAKKPITDPAQIERTKQAVDQLATASQQLARQFNSASGSADQFGTTGTQAANQVTGALNQTGAAAQQVGAGLQQSAVKFGAVAGAVAGVFQAATSKLIGIVGELRAAFAPSALLKGVVETGKEISDQADKIKATTEQWIALRKEIAASGISNADFVKSAEGVVKKLEESRGGVARLSGSITESTHAVQGGAISILRFNDRLKEGGVQANQFASEIAKLGTDGSKALRLFAAGDTQGALRAIANGIANITDGQQRAAVGAKIFGSNWQEMIKILRGGEDGINDLKKAMDDARKAARDLTTDQVDAAKKLGETWDDLGSAVRSLKDNLGALFIGGAQTRAEWLTRLVDESRKLVQIWSKLAEEKKAAFLEDLGESPAETLFKTLIAISTQLGNIWRNVLVPAGNALMNVFKQMAASINAAFGDFKGGTSTAQIVAFFVTAAAAALALSIALKAVGLALAPLMLLFTPFGAILVAAGAAAVVFWDQIAAGAEKVAALIPNSLDLIKSAIANLFAGNFAKAWDQFKEGAVAAFNTVAQAANQAEGPIGDFARGLVQIGTDAPAAIQLVIDILLALGQAATTVAKTINAIFGTKLTGTDIAIVAIVLQLTGGLAALAAAATIVGAAFSVMLGIIGTLVTVFGGPVTAAILAVIAAGVLLIANWDEIKAAAQSLWDFLKPFGGLDQAVAQVFNNMVQSVLAAWESIKSGAQSAALAVTEFMTAAFDAIIGKVQTLIGWLQSAWDWLKKIFAADVPKGEAAGMGLLPGMARGGHVRGPGTAT